MDDRLVVMPVNELAGAPRLGPNPLVAGGHNYAGRLAFSMVEYSDLPDELPRGQRRSMKRVRAVSNLLDEAFRVPGTNFRIGLDPILGLLPVGGDTASALISLYIVLEAYLMGVPRHVLARMVMNILIDTFGGVVPILGSVFDAAWKANRRNLELLEKHVERH